MSLILPAPSWTLHENNLPATPVTGPGLRVNFGSVAHTKGAWEELFAATAFDTSSVVITVLVNTQSATDTSTLLDIGIGAAASESVIIPDLLAGFAQDSGIEPGPRSFTFPLYIPAGSRLAARAQSTRSSAWTVRVVVDLYGAPTSPDRPWVGQEVIAYGVNAATSGGVDVTAGNSGAEGTTTVIGTTTQDHKMLAVGVQGGVGLTNMGSSTYHWSLGIGATSTSWLIENGLVMRTDNLEGCGPIGFPWPNIYTGIPSGSELVMRGTCQGTADPLALALYGVS